MMKRFLSTLLAAGILLLTLGACGRSDQTDPSEQQAVFSGHFAIYKNRIYSGGISAYSLYELNMDKIAAGEANYAELLCKDALCSHNSAYCVAYLNASSAEVLAEPTEGVMPNVYVSYQPLVNNINGSEITVDSGNGVLLRINLNDGTKKLLTDQLESCALQTALYGDSLYFITEGKTESGMRYRIGKISKNGGEITYYTPEEDTQLHLIDIADRKVYFNDQKGNIYTADEKLEDVSLLFTLPERMTSTNDDAADFCVRIYRGWLYFRQNYRATGYVDHYASDYYRLPLNDLQSAPELVFENLLTDHVYGFEGDLLYYAKAELQDGYTVIDPTTGVSKNRVTETGGNVYVYDLAKSEEKKLVSDIGVDLSADGCLANGYYVTIETSVYKQDGHAGYHILNLQNGELNHFEIYGTEFGF